MGMAGKPKAPRSGEAPAMGLHRGNHDPKQSRFSAFQSQAGHEYSTQAAQDKEILWNYNFSPHVHPCIQHLWQVHQLSIAFGGYSRASNPADQPDDSKPLKSVGSLKGSFFQ